MAIFTILSASAANAATGIPSEGEQLMSTLMMLGLIFIVFYILLLRPQQRKFKMHQQMISNLTKGDKVITSGGIIGKITKVNKDNGLLDLEIASGIEIKILAATIASLHEPKTKPVNDN